jgi:cyanuric acid amidohydrolase
MQPNSFNVIRIPTSGPGDVSGLMAVIDSGALEPSSILAILGKTEGNGGVNDFTREYAVAALCNALSPHLGLAPHAVESRIAFVMSGGTEGVLSPHMTVFARGRPPEGADERPSEKPPPDQRAGPGGRRARPDRSHRERLCVDGLFARRLGDRRRQSAGRDRGRRRRRSGAEGLEAIFIGRVLLGRHRAHAQRRHSGRRLALLVEPVQDWPCVMRDAIDLPAVMQALESLGLSALDARSQGRLVNIFAKAEASPDGAIRGLRHTMLDDSDINATRHARAAVGGLIGGVAGTGAVYVSGGAEHQGPAGGGPVAVIARAEA